jgi:hypothetical protein
MKPSVPLLIGVIIAVGSYTQDNLGGAIFAVAAGLIISLVLYLKPAHKRGR